MSNAIAAGGPLPVAAIGTRASGWWGTWFLLLSEAALFAYLFFSYFYFAVQPSASWAPGGPPGFTYPAPQTALVLIGCFTSAYAERAIGRGALAATLIGIGLMLVLGALFILMQFLDWFDKPYGLATSTYSSEYFVITGLHLAHFVVGWVMFLVLLIWTGAGYFDQVRHLPITVGKLYWYFVTAIWLAVFFVLDITPYFFR